MPFTKHINCSNNLDLTELKTNNTSGVFHQMQKRV